MFKLVVLYWIYPCDNIVRVYYIIAKYFSKIFYKGKKQCTDCDKANAYIPYANNEVCSEELMTRISGVLNICFSVS